MSVVVNIQVTQTPTHLQQIGSLVVVNRGPSTYEVNWDGETLGFVNHYPEEHVSLLLIEAFTLVADKKGRTNWKG